MNDNIYTTHTHTCMSLSRCTGIVHWRSYISRWLAILFKLESFNPKPLAAVWRVNGNCESVKVWKCEERMMHKRMMNIITSSSNGVDIWFQVSTAIALRRSICKWNTQRERLHGSRFWSNIVVFFFLSFIFFESFGKEYIYNKCLRKWMTVERATNTEPTI